MSETTSRMNYTYPSRDEDPWYDSFQSLVTALDSSTFAHREDRSLVFAGGGTLSWTVGTSTLTWNDTIQIASTISGRRISVSADSVVLGDGQILYLDLTRQPLQNISTSFQIADQLPSTNNACAVAVRIGGVVFFRTGISLSDGTTSPGIAPVPSAGGGGPGSDTTAIHDNQAGEIAAIGSKGTPTTSDLLLIEDAASANAKAKITIGDLPAATPATHAIGGSEHSSSTIAQLNALVSDATLDGTGDPRTDNDAIHDNVAGEITGIASKGSPTVSDVLVIEDVADGNSKKSITIGSLPGGSGTDPDAIHDNVAAEISAITPKATPTTSDYLIIEDAGDAGNKKSITIGDLPATTPASHASTHEPGGGDALTVDAAAATGSLRTLGTGAAQACAGNDSRLSDARTPTSHNTSHQSGGGDAIKLDDLASPDDNTDLDSTVSAHGLLPKLGGGTTNYLRADGTWSAPPGVPLSDTAPVDVDPQAASAGVASEASRQDHKHDIVTAAAGAATPGDAAAEGTANSLARSDHQHSLPAFGSTTGTFCEGDDSRLSDARTPTAHASSHESGGGDVVAHQNLSGVGTNTHAQIDTHISNTSNPHTVTAAQVGNTTAQWNADQLQGIDIDAALSPTDGQVLAYDGTGTQWTAASPAEGTSYLEMGQNHTITSAGGSPDSEDVGRGVFDASQHNTITFRAVLNSAYATTGSSSLKLYDDGSLATPGTPRLVTTFTQTDDSLTYEVFEQALTVVASGPTTNEILGVGRVYRAVIEITATSSDTTTVSTVGFAAVGNGDVVTLSADAIQAIAMSLNA